MGLVGGGLGAATKNRRAVIGKMRVNRARRITTYQFGVDDPAGWLEGKSVWTACEDMRAVLSYH